MKVADAVDRLGWRVTQALWWIGPAVVLVTVGAAVLVMATDPRRPQLGFGLLLLAGFMFFTFAVAITVGTWIFGPRQDKR